MASKIELSNYNEAIANASNNIGQKLFAYIANGKNINDRIREKFAKSLIFIGDEGQIYNPLTNTYVGIGQTAYTSTISYIEDAHEKIAALTQMLASSMVSAIYANWSENEWKNAYNPYFGNIDNGQPEISSVMPSKIYATNEIILKGLGDYDPSTKLAATREYAHITDENAEENDNLSKLYNNTFKTVNQNIAWKYTYNTKNKDDAPIEIGGYTVAPGQSVLMKTELTDLPTYVSREKVGTSSAFATSGITVSLNKGINNYLFSYTFTCRPTDCIDDRKATFLDCIAYAGYPSSTNEFSKTFSLYLTQKEYEDYVDATCVCLVDNTGTTNLPTIKDNDDNDLLTNVGGVELYFNFLYGLEPTYEDGAAVEITRETSFADNEARKNALYTLKTTIINNINSQLFKQSANTLTIDDKLTWSYIASAYTYSIAFSKEYTDNQVNKIYRELLGEQSALIPATLGQAKVIVPNNAAALNEDLLIWNENEKKWGKPTSDSDSIYESSSNLSDYVLDYSSTFVLEYEIKDDDNHYLDGDNRLNADKPNGPNEYTSRDVACTVYPWHVLDKLAQYLAKIKNEAKNEWTKLQDVNDDDFADYLWEYVDNKLKTAPVEGKEDEDERFFAEYWNGTEYVKENTPLFIGGKNDLETALFMGYDRTLESAHKNESFVRDNEFENFTTDEPEGNYQSSNDIDAGSANYGYTGTKYSLRTLYRVLIPEDITNEKIYEDVNPLYVVNTSFVANDSINLADGIQTLKEVAYVLDMITDGWGNQYEDAEGNGILLTYTIANNHERIVDHEKRLRELEGGKNVVRGIYKDAYTMSKYVNLRITSDTSWIKSNSKWISPEPLTYVPTNFTYTWYAVTTGNEKQTGQSEEQTCYYFNNVPQSYLYSYSLIVDEYKSHSTHSDTGLTAPNFESLFGIDTIGFVEFSYTEGSYSFFKDADGNNIATIPTYTGQVGLGIDLNIATTYNTSVYCDNGNDGFEVVDLTSSNVNKTGRLSLTVSYAISTDANMKTFTEPTQNDGNYDSAYVNKEQYRFTQSEISELNNNQSFIAVKDGILAKYASEISEYLSEFGLSNCTLNVTGIDREYTGIDIDDLVLTITGYTGTSYRAQIFDSAKTVVADPNAVTTDGDGNTVSSPKTFEISVKDLPTSTYYIRKAQAIETIVSMDKNALTDVNWVATYVSQAIRGVNRSVKSVEIEVYQYSKSLISQMDGSFVSSYGMYVAGITQKDGKVTPIVRELPKDNITASTTVWGETTTATKTYAEVLANDIENEIAMDTPLFIKDGYEYYEVVPNANNTVASDEEATQHAKVNGELVYDANGNKVDYGEALDVQISSSVKVGPAYRNFVQYYFRRDKYVQIDGADLRKVEGTWQLLTGYTHGENEGDPDVPVYATTFYKLADAGQPEAVKKYISAEVDYQSDYTDGVGGNNFKVTAHITKLSDASKDNSGLVDAYDVRNTLDNMFEWVDLSRWDADLDEDKNPINEPNPVNTAAYVENEGITAATRINDTKLANAGSGKSNSLGYPIDLSTSNTEAPGA